MDLFTKRRALEIMRKSHFDSARAVLSLAEEFGSRVAYAVKAGIPRDLAIESCREHFKIIGQAMADHADDFARLMIEKKVGQDSGQGSVRKDEK